MGSEASIHKATHNPKGHTKNVGDPVVHVGAAVKVRLDEFNETAEGTRPHKHGSKPMRPVLAGKERAAKAMRCTTLSLPSGAGGGASNGQSMTTVRVSVTMRVIGMSRYLRIYEATGHRG